MLCADVQRLLDRRWSPEQIAASLTNAAPTTVISTEAIYQALYSADTPLVREGRLRTGRTRRLQRRHGERRRSRFVVPMVSISRRPVSVLDRLVGGHWEGDLIIGKDNGSAIATLVERVTRFTILVHLGRTRSAEHLRDEMIDTFDQLPAHARLSLTWDQGMEMCHHHHISAALTMPVYFCDPHSPWQRGTNENTNGLLRQYFPKGHRPVRPLENGTRPRRPRTQPPTTQDPCLGHTRSPIRYPPRRRCVATTFRIRRHSHGRARRKTVDISHLEVGASPSSCPRTPRLRGRTLAPLRLNLERQRRSSSLGPIVRVGLRHAVTDHRRSIACTARRPRP